MCSKVENEKEKEIVPHENDVLCGRGGSINNHAGNENYRIFVNRKKRVYLTARFKREKRLIASSIVEEVRALNPPGRFLAKNARTNSWYDIGDLKARDKTSQALREGAPEIRKEMECDRRKKLADARKDLLSEEDDYEYDEDDMDCDDDKKNMSSQRTDEHTNTEEEEKVKVPAKLKAVPQVQKNDTLNITPVTSTKVPSQFSAYQNNPTQQKSLTSMMKIPNEEQSNTMFKPDFASLSIQEHRPTYHHQHYPSNAPRNNGFHPGTIPSMTNGNELRYSNPSTTFEQHPQAVNNFYGQSNQQFHAPYVQNYNGHHQQQSPNYEAASWGQYPMPSSNMIHPNLEGGQSSPLYHSKDSKVNFDQSCSSNLTMSQMDVNSPQQHASQEITNDFQQRTEHLPLQQQRAEFRKFLHEQHERKQLVDSFVNSPPREEHKYYNDKSRQNSILDGIGDGCTPRNNQTSRYDYERHQHKMGEKFSSVAQSNQDPAAYQYKNSPPVVHSSNNPQPNQNSWNTTKVERVESHHFRSSNRVQGHHSHLQQTTPPRVSFKAGVDECRHTRPPSPPESGDTKMEDVTQMHARTNDVSFTNQETKSVQAQRLPLVKKSKEELVESRVESSNWWCGSTSMFPFFRSNSFTEGDGASFCGFDMCSVHSLGGASLCGVFLEDDPTRKNTQVEVSFKNNNYQGVQHARSWGSVRSKSSLGSVGSGHFSLSSADRSLISKNSDKGLNAIGELRENMHSPIPVEHSHMQYDFELPWGTKRGRHRE